ncbi:hypothetical protein BpHYR1_012825 [Brachionus plicatilis]|uniref:Uncharacterized protein n=1 Tax=Brachionus plicatilis TaxID=10195 RepID=A0A3M7SJS0_BRAPC|nr:hypothetical protein BpHYR1_012825 [Brachionus plicatilis]
MHNGFLYDHIVNSKTGLDINFSDFDLNKGAKIINKYYYSSDMIMVSQIIAVSGINENKP